MPFQNLYPVNYLRNVAVNNVVTPYVFLSDIDFLPGKDVYFNLRKNIETMMLGKEEKLALVVPAFETERYKLDDFPRTKADVLQLLNLGKLLTFR